MPHFEPRSPGPNSPQPSADEPSAAEPGAAEPKAAEPTSDERWLVIDGRRWRRTDPCLPPDLVEGLKSYLGKGRSAVRVAKRDGDDDRLAAARRMVDAVKHGLGERGPYWWDEPETTRIARADEVLRRLDQSHP